MSTFLSSRLPLALIDRVSPPGTERLWQHEIHQLDSRGNTSKWSKHSQLKEPYSAAFLQPGTDACVGPNAVPYPETPLRSQDGPVKGRRAKVEHSYKR